MSTQSRSQSRVAFAGNLLAIDPSIRSLGWCVHRFNQTPLAAGLITLGNGGSSYQFRAVRMAHTVAALAMAFLPEVVGVECPNNWFSARGTASKDSEDVQRLYLAVGAILATVSNIKSVKSIWTVRPDQWKGQTPKDVMVKRAIAYAAEHNAALSDTTHDACEALLLGRYAIANLGTNSSGVPALRGNWELAWDRGDRGNEVATVSQALAQLRRG
jgi:hypothetical protein